MAINVKFDLVGNPEPPIILLANRNGNILGQLDVDVESIDMSDKFNDASEFSFTLYKYVDDKLTNLWDKVLDFKLVYCKEWDEWFEIKVELDEETETIKTVFCTQLEKAELSQLNLYNVEINTEKDIERDDYKICILYDENDEESSILNRLLKDKASHYSIVHVDSTIANIQRSFSFDNISIDDAFQEISEEIGCVFIYHSYFDKNRILRRTISVYDLEQNCNDCGHRGEFTNVCPKCDSTNIKNGYGEDTLIFVTSDELASEGIQLTTDTDSVKNCFKLEAGDDLMTATIRNCNPNGSDYIWRFSDMIKEDMSDSLKNKLDSYNDMYKEYYDKAKSSINYDQLVLYNRLINKYKVYDDNLKKITTPITGYPALMNAYYDTIDLALYLKSGLMPSIEMSDTDAIKQASLLTKSTLSPVAVNTDNTSSISLTTANSAVLSMAKVVVKSTYKVEINTSTISSDKKTWTGSFVITNYSDEEDTAISNTVSVTINNNVETFIKQKIEKALNKEDVDDYSISGLFKNDYDDFCAELKKYALNPLKSFYDACNVCIDILIDQGAGNKNEKPDLYKNLYKPYYDKSFAIANEIKIREDEIAVIEGVWDRTDESNPKLTTKGLQYYIEDCRNKIQNALNFEEYLGEELWVEFCGYRREDTYSNSNYISDGLNNAELFEKALEFIEVAENEIYKSSELQHSISTSLNNLLAIDKFKALISSFKVGNWIRIQINDEVYKLRLLEYEIDFGNFDNISVEFSDVTKIKNGVTDVESILSQASSMATSYTSTQRQAKQGDDAKNTVDKWFSNGLNSALVQIQNNNNEEVILNRNGLLCRSYDDITELYSPEQFRLTHNIMAYTTDNWKTVSSALGKHDYVYYDVNKTLQQATDYGLTAKFVTAGYINGSQIIGGEIYSSNYEQNKKGTYFNLVAGDFELANGKFIYNDKDSKLSIRDVAIDWNTSTNPNIEHVIGLTDNLEGLSSRITINKNAITSEVTRATEAEGTLSSKISQTATEIRAEVKAADDKLSSTISQTAESITSTVSKTYETKSNASANYTKLQSSITQNAEAIELRVQKGDVVSTINQSADLISINSNRIEINSTNFTLTKTGVITAKSGTIGGWEITSNSLIHRNSNDDPLIFLSGTGSQSGNYTVGSHTGKDWSIWSNSKFGVTNTGKLYATSAEIGGKITASSGEISGNLNISGSLVNTSGDYSVTLRAVQDNKSYGVFYITDKSSGSNVYPFIVSGDGSFKATKATITGDSTFGGTLNAADGTFKGKLSAVSGTFTTLSAGKSSFSKNQVIINASYEDSNGDEISKGSIYIGRSGVEGWEDITIRPSSDNLGNIGTAGKSWDMLYVKNGAVHSSDRNYKKDITVMGEKQEQLFNLLIPVTFKFIDSTYDRFHYGFISQEVEDAIIKSGLTTKDFAGFCKDIKRDENGFAILDENGNPEYAYSLRYTEFIALNTHMIKRVQAENRELKERIVLLEEKMKQLS